MKTILWDFDGTLGYRHNGMWTASLLEAIHFIEPDHPIQYDELLPHLQKGFPWDEYETPHPQLNDPDIWWQAMRNRLIKMGISAGLEPALVKQATLLFRDIYTDLSRWRLFEDTLPTLSHLCELGWQHAVLSNHVPELKSILSRLNLTPWLCAVFNSAETGFEKPHVQAYRTALETLKNPETVWMVGDNPIADVQGAEALGIPAILVHQPVPKIARFAPTLHDVIPFLTGD